jgi:hypothetical protein
MAAPCRTSTEHPNTAYLLYIDGTTDNIPGLLKEHRIHTVQQTLNKMVSKFKYTKDRQPPTQKLFVYKISGSCGKVYVRQAINSPPVSETYHRLKNCQSQVAKHSAATKHSVDFDKMEVICNIRACCLHVIREAIVISNPPPPILTV